MNLTYEFAIYLFIINIASGIFFAYDKLAAKKNRRRIPEPTLHLFELAGGVFANIMLMYVLRHKNRKFSYWIWTWLLMIGWIAMMIINFKFDH